MTATDVSSSGERTRILVVDDEPHIGLILRTRLEQGPFEVLLASDSVEAFRLLADHTDVALLILDIMLPGLSGIQILAQLRADPAWAKVPVIVLTAAGQDAQLREAESLGVVAVMTKPFSPRRLYERVVTLMASSPSSSRTSHSHLAASLLSSGSPASDVAPLPS